MAANEIIGSKCTKCFNVTYPKRIFCPKCSEKALQDVKLSNEGTIYTFTHVQYPLAKYENPPYSVAVIDILHSQTRVTARITTDDMKKIVIGAKVILEARDFPESGDLEILEATIV